MKVSWDRKNHLAYIALIDIPRGGVKRSIKVGEDKPIILDFDAAGQLVGIELLDDMYLHPILREQAA